MKIPKAVVKLRYHCFYQNNKYNMINKHRKGSNLFVVPLLLEPVCLATVCALRWPNGASCESESYGCLICFKFSLLTKLFHIIIIFGLVFRFCKKSLQLKLCFQAEKKKSFRICNPKADEVVFGCLEQNYFVTCQNLHKNHQVCHARGQIS